MLCRPVWMFVALIALCGCNSKARVNGAVTLDGKALESGEVMFHPTAQGALAVGTIENGSYALSTGQSDDVEPGTYKATIIATGKPPEGLQTDANGQQMEAVGARLTPEIYADPKTTPFEFTVKAGSQRIDLPLKSQ